MTENSKASGRRPQIKIIIICLIALVLISALIGLGSWQIQRLGWKHDLITRIENNIQAERISAPNATEWKNSDQKALEYRAVYVRGHYLNDMETHVGALTNKGAGYWIVTPFQRDTGEIIFINRGFVVSEKRDPNSRASGQLTGETTVTGLLRLSEPKGFFLRSNDPDKNIWYARDVQAFAKRFQLINIPDYFIDANAQENRSDRPEGGMTVVKFADNHLTYALTWFTLAIMVLAMAIYLIRCEIRQDYSQDD